MTELVFILIVAAPWQGWRRTPSAASTHDREAAEAGEALVSTVLFRQR